MKDVISKKSFVLYADLIHTVSQLPPDKQGELFMHILNYVNDQDEPSSDILIEVAFIPIKLQLRRDFKKYEETISGRSKAGLASAETKKNKLQQTLTKSAVVKNVQQDGTNSTVNEIVNETVDDIGNIIILNKIGIQFSVKDFFYEGHPSDLALSQDYVGFLNARLKNKKISMNDFIIAFNDEYLAKSFSDSTHFKNSIGLTIKKLTNGSTKKLDSFNGSSKSKISANKTGNFKEYGSSKF